MITIRTKEANGHAAESLKNFNQPLLSDELHYEADVLS
jgi:hypothetical protein